MKKTIFILTLLTTLFGCSSDNYDDITLKNEKNLTLLQQIATENGFTLTKSTDEANVYKVSSIEELKTVIRNMNTDMEQSKVKTIGETTNTFIVQAEKIIKKFREANLINKKNNFLTNSSYDDEGEIDPPYKYSTTTYFDNEFPAANVFVTINYNVNSAGYLSNAEVITGSWGYSMGGYQQNNVVGMVQNGIFVFQVTGQLTGSVGFGNFSLSRSNEIEISVYFQVQGNGGLGYILEENKQKKGKEVEQLN